MIEAGDSEDDLLRSVAMQNVQSILLARQRAEDELVRAKQALEHRTDALARSLSVLRATLDATADGILVSDDAGGVVEFNEKHVSMWEVPVKLAATRNHRDLIDYFASRMKDARQFMRQVDHICASAALDTFDQLELQDGRTFECVTRPQMMEGQRVGRVWSFRDVTERKRGEEASRDEARILKLLNRMAAALASKLDLKSIAQVVTDAATELSGARVGALVYAVVDGSGDASVLHALSGIPHQGDAATPDWAERAPAFLLAERETIRRDDIVLEPPYDGMPLDLGVLAGLPPLHSYLSVPILSGLGEASGGLFLGHPERAVFNERTARLIEGIAAQAGVSIDNARLYEAARHAAEEREHLLESERFARGQAERMSEMKDEFLATLSHELRTPLSAILGWAQLLQRGHRSATDYQKAVEAIERNARVQVQLIEDLLDMSRITSGTLRLDVQPLQPVHFVEAAIETVRPAALAKEIRIDRLLDPTAGPISGDPGRLQQVLWNLLANAIKFTPKGGKVQVLLERVNSHIELSVSDTGVGIRTDFLEHVFERFRQADASTARRYGGLGLGLSIAKRLVELHGGSIYARSAGEGTGTTFVIQLPLLAMHPGPERQARVHPATAPLPPSQFDPIDLAGLKVLIVDDEADARELVSHLLEDCGATVFSAATAIEALALLETNRPHVLISDIGMPGVDGFELLRRVRALGQARGGGVPAIALTAFARSEDRTRTLRAGFLVHVSKPVDPSELIATVATVAGRTG